MVFTQVNEFAYIPLPGKIQHLDTLPLIVLTFIDASAPSQGVPRHLSSYLVAIANAGSGVGRLSCGLIADRIGACIPTPSLHITSFTLSPLDLPPTSYLLFEKKSSEKWTGAMNAITPALFFTSILTFLWPHLRGTGALVTLALLYGASLGGFVALLSAPMIALGDSTDVGRRTGTFLTVISLCSLAGPPISGAIYHTMGGYSVAGMYAGRLSPSFLVSLSPECLTHVSGSTMMVSVVLLALSRYFVLRRWRGRV